MTEPGTCSLHAPSGRRKKEVIFGLGKSNSMYQTNTKESIMKATAPLQLREAGQSLWLDNITRDLLTSGTLKRYIDELSITGLTSNPTIFDHAITKSQAYDAAIRQHIRQGTSDEELFFSLALEDLTQAADLFRPIYDATDGVDGWVSLEVSPLLAYDTASTIAQAKELHTRAGRPNLFIKIPGTKEGLPAIEEAIVAGVPVNVTLLFSREHYVAAAEAFLRGIERRIDAGLTPEVGSVASLFVSRWDAAVRGKDLARWLQLYIASHAKPYPVKVATLRDLSGSRAKALKNFRGKLRLALNDLVNNDDIERWEIQMPQDLLFVDRGTTISASQSRHLGRNKTRT